MVSLVNERRWEADPEACPINYNCQIGELGNWGGEADSSYRHISYEVAIKFITDYQKYETYYTLISSTISSQIEARRALRDKGFKTIKGIVSGNTGNKTFLHFWNKNMPTCRKEK